MATALVQCMMRSGSGCSRRPCRVCDLTVARAIWNVFVIESAFGSASSNVASLRATRSRHNQVVLKFPCWSRERRMMRNRVHVVGPPGRCVDRSRARHAGAGLTPGLLPVVVAEGGAHSDPQVAPAKAATDDDEENLSPEEKMRRRFPQPVRVGDLIGLPLLDWDDCHPRPRAPRRAHAGGKDPAHRQSRPVVRMGRTPGAGADRGGGHSGAAARPARHIGGKISRRPGLVRGQHPTDSIRRHDQDRRLAPLIRLRRWRRSSTALLPVRRRGRAPSAARRGQAPWR